MFVSYIILIVSLFSKLWAVYGYSLVVDFIYASVYACMYIHMYTMFIFYNLFVCGCFFRPILVDHPQTVARRSVQRLARPVATSSSTSS